MIFGELASDGALESIDVVNSFADEGAFLEDILVDVGDGAGVGIDAGLAGEKLGEARSTGAGHADADARLEDGCIPR